MELQNIIGIILSILVCICLTFIVCIYIKTKKYKEEYIEKRKKEFDEALTKEAKALETATYNRKLAQKNFEEWKEQEIKHIQEREEVAKKYVDSLEEQKRVRLQAEEEAQAQGKFNLDNLLQRYFNKEYNEYADQLQEVKENLLASAENEFYNTCASLNSDIASLRTELNEYQEKRNAINAEILRQRAVSEQQDFYRICITDQDLEDIEILLSMKARLHKTSFLDKIIYDTYVSKYVKEMAKRVLTGRDPSGIYKVTNIKTNEIYIGKSTTIATRWQNHCKSAFGLEGVADSQFQRALKKYGVQSFTWELLEEIPKDKLTEREKYYITFYDTVTYGYNQKVG